MLRERSLNELINAAAFARLQRLKRPVLCRKQTRGEKKSTDLDDAA
jgi:hypothetical protein